MTRYSIEITPTAERQLKSLDDATKRRVARAMMALASEARPRGSRKLQGYDDVFRVRVGAYRILYSINNRQLIIIVLQLGHRRDIYR